MESVSTDKRYLEMQIGRPFFFFAGLSTFVAGVSLLSLFDFPFYLRVILMILYVVILFMFSFIHGTQTIGLRSIMVFLGITVAVTYFMEWLGTHFGFPFGLYYYTSRLGPLLADVPIIIPIQWFNILYVCYIMARIIIYRGDGTIQAQNPVLIEQRSSFLIILSVSILSGLFMVAWDLINDPFMVGIGAWVWTDPAWFFGLSFYGVPLSNFIGWLSTGSLAIFLFEIYRRNWRINAGWVGGTMRNPANLIVIVPYFLAYIIQAVQGVTGGVFPLESQMGWVPLVAGAVAMGLAILMTILSYVWHLRQSQ